MFTWIYIIYVSTTVFGFVSKINFGRSCFLGCWLFPGFWRWVLVRSSVSLFLRFGYFFKRDSIFRRCLIILDLYLFPSKFWFYPEWLFVLLFCWRLLCSLSVPILLWLPRTLVLSTLITVELFTVFILLLTKIFESWICVVWDWCLCWCK